MKALELDPKMEVAQRNLEIAYFNTGYYDTRVAGAEGAAAPAPRRSRRALGAWAHVRAARPAARSGRASSARCCSTARATSARCSSSRSPRSSPATSSARRQYLERALELDAESSLLHFALGEVLYHRGLNEEALGALRARRRAESRESRRALSDGLRARRHGAARRGAGGDAPRDSAQSRAVARAGEPRDRSRSASRRPDAEAARRNASCR